MVRIGDAVAQYEVEGFLGAGGMGRVYLVRHQSTGERRALKLLDTPGPGARARLLREGRLQARLSHPNVVRSYETLQLEDRVGLLLEYVVGPTLADLLERGEALPLPQVEAMFRGIADGVAAAHRLGIVHRDLKPQNVLLFPTPEGFVPKVTDFGIAKAVEGDDAATHTGAVLGTPLYMAPEQFRDAKRVDSRADVYALGAIAAQMLTGRCHREGVADLQEALDRARSGPPRQLYLAVPNLPDRILAAVTAAMAPRPEQRPPTALELRHIWDGRLAWQPEDPLRTLDPDAPVAPCVLPAERDSFVGRRADLRALSDRAGPGRLVTVAGPAGVGKTRLALRFAWSTHREWPGGVWFADARQATDGAGLVHAVADALGIKLLAARAVDCVGQALAAHGRCLIVLDNLEQLGSKAAEPVGRWSDLAPQACVVATSRRVIGVRGEQILELEPLPVDEGATLFAHRARAVHRRFDPSPSDQDAIAALVEVLDGLPLAIELIASRTRLMTPARMLEQLSSGPGLFRVAARSGPPGDRHATLRAALDWSWSLLEPHERDALAQLSVFRGGFSLAAAEAVVVPEAGPGSTGAEPPWTFEVLQALLDQSLLRTVGPDRFDLLYVVRAFGEEKLGPEARDAVERRHGAYFARLADDAERMDRPYERHAALAPDLHNLVAASERAAARGDGEIAAATALAAWDVLDVRGAYAWAADVLERAADRATPAQARVLSSLGTALERTGRAQQALERHQQALDIFCARGDLLGQARVRTCIATVHKVQGRMALAQQEFDEALRLARETGDRRLEAIGRVCLGNLHLEQDRFELAREHFETALRIGRDVGDRRLESQALGRIALVLARRGEVALALEHALASLEIARALGDRSQECLLLGNLADAYRDLGRDRLALDHIEQALRLVREIGDRRYEGMLLGNLGCMEWDRGDLQQARARFEEALAIAREVGNRQHEGVMLGRLGEVRAEQGERDEALAHLEQALVLVRDVGYRRSEGEILGVVGLVHAGAGRFEAARAALDAGAAVLRGLDAPRELASLLAKRARAERMAGDPAAAEAALEEAEQLARQLGDATGTALRREVAAARVAVRG